MGSPETAPKIKLPKAWFVYILRCANGSLYTGITTDIEKRLQVHNDGKGSAYVRAHRPAKLAAFTVLESRSVASVLESRIKSLSRTGKLALIKKWNAEQRAGRSISPKGSLSKLTGKKAPRSKKITEA